MNNLHTFEDTESDSGRYQVPEKLHPGTPETPDFENVHEQLMEQIKKLDDEFVVYMLQIEEKYQKFLMKPDKLKVENWSKVLCQVIHDTATLNG